MFFLTLACTKNYYTLNCLFKEISHATETMEDEIYTLDPSFQGYQLVGDSQMVRFGEQILGLQRLQTPTSNIRFYVIKYSIVYFLVFVIIVFDICSCRIIV